MRVVIERYRSQFACDKQTLGTLFVVDSMNRIVYTCHTLELPDFNNQRQKSNIPAGKYKVVKRNSQKYGNHFHILDVPNRDYILIHQGNYYTQILGCILVGSGLSDINNDGIIDVTNSVATMKKLNEILTNDFQIEII